MFDCAPVLLPPCMLCRPAASPDLSNQLVSFPPLAKALMGCEAVAAAVASSPGLAAALGASRQAAELVVGLPGFATLAVGDEVACELLGAGNAVRSGPWLGSWLAVSWHLTRGNASGPAAPGAGNTLYHSTCAWGAYEMR